MYRQRLNNKHTLLELMIIIVILSLALELYSTKKFAINPFSSSILRSKAIRITTKPGTGKAPVHNLGSNIAGNVIEASVPLAIQIPNVKLDAVVPTVSFIQSNQLYHSEATATSAITIPDGQSRWPYLGNCSQAVGCSSTAWNSIEYKTTWTQLQNSSLRFPLPTNLSETSPLQASTKLAVLSPKLLTSYTSIHSRNSTNLLNSASILANFSQTIVPVFTASLLSLDSARPAIIQQTQKVTQPSMNSEMNSVTSQQIITSDLLLSSNLELDNLLATSTAETQTIEPASSTVTTAIQPLSETVSQTATTEQLSSNALKTVAAEAKEQANPGSSRTDDWGNIIVPAIIAETPTEQQQPASMVIVKPVTELDQPKPLKLIDDNNRIIGVVLSDKMIVLQLLSCPLYRIFQTTNAEKLVVELDQVLTSLQNSQYSDNPVFQSVSFIPKNNTLQVVFSLKGALEILANYLATEDAKCQLIIKYEAPFIQLPIEPKTASGVAPISATATTAETVEQSTSIPAATGTTEQIATATNLSNGHSTQINSSNAQKPATQQPISGVESNSTAKTQSNVSKESQQSSKNTSSTAPAMPSHSPHVSTIDTTASSKTKSASVATGSLEAKANSDNGNSAIQATINDPLNPAKVGGLNLADLVKDNTLKEYQPPAKESEATVLIDQKVATTQHTIADLIQQNTLDTQALAAIAKNQTPEPEKTAPQPKINNTTATGNPSQQSSNYDPIAQLAMQNAHYGNVVSSSATAKPATPAKVATRPATANTTIPKSTAKILNTSTKSNAKKQPSIIKPTTSNKINRNKQRKVIILDAGHGGKDPGAIGVNGTKEKYLTLKYVQSIQDHLERRYAKKYEVVLTRDRDIFIPLSRRVKISRDHDADLFISIHADSSTNNKARGLSVYTLSTTASDKETAKLAARENAADKIGGISFATANKTTFQTLLDLARTTTINSSNNFAEIVKQQAGKRLNLTKSPHRYAGFTVLTAPDVPSALVEIGFLSNSKDEYLLKSSGYRNKVVEAIVESINQYFDGR